MVIKRAGKSGKSFYGCENYPECDFVSWDKPLEEKCSECGAYMVESKFRYGGKTYKNVQIRMRDESEKRKRMERKKVNVIGAGLAGCEWRINCKTRGSRTALNEAGKKSPAHTSELFAGLCATILFGPTVSAMRRDC